MLIYLNKIFKLMIDISPIYFKYYINEKIQLKMS